MGTLNVTTYRVGTNRSRANAQAHRFFLSLEGFAESGAATSAVVYFWPTQPTDTVGYVAGNLLVGMLDDADFAGWYDILRSERPVKVTYVEGPLESVRIDPGDLVVSAHACGALSEAAHIVANESGRPRHPTGRDPSAALAPGVR